MQRMGKDVEKVVLSRALRLALEDRIFVYANKTVIFQMIYTKMRKAHFSGMDNMSLQPPKATKQANAVFAWQKCFFRKTMFLIGINDCKI